MSVAAKSSTPAEVAAIVRMLQEELEATSRENMLLTLELEQRVAERTAELAFSNTELLKQVAERIRAEAEIKNLNRDLERRAELLQAANEELEAFSSSVSHDLRNPLCRVQGFAMLLQDSDERLSDERPRRYVTNICDAVGKMSELIDDLLRLSYSSSAPLVLGSVDLNLLIADVIADLQENQQKVKWICERLPVIVADASLLRQAFMNLLSNAVKYSRQCVSPKVEVGTIERTGDEWTIFVRDNGVGFDAAKADKLFTAFHRMHSSAEFEGTGIGLVNVRRIVLRHGGKVWAESRPSRGATFYVGLPKEVTLAIRESN